MTKTDVATVADQCGGRRQGRAAGWMIVQIRIRCVSWIRYPCNVTAFAIPAAHTASAGSAVHPNGEPARSTAD